MLIAEALMYRRELKTRLDDTSRRLKLVAVVKQGSKPLEDPAALLTQFDEQLQEFKVLIQAIHRTNLTARVTDGRSVTEAIVERDMLDERIALLRKVEETILERGNEHQDVFGGNRIPLVATVDLVALRQDVSAMASQRRKLDMEIQRANWAHELVEVPMN